MPFRLSSGGKSLQSPTSDRPSGSRSTTTKRLYDPARDTEVEVPAIRGSPDPPQHIEREPSPPPRPRLTRTPSPISSPAADTTLAADEPIADVHEADLVPNAEPDTAATVAAEADADANADGEAEPEIEAASRPQKRAPARRRPAKRRQSVKVVDAEDAESAAGDTPRLPPTFGEVAEANALRAGKSDTAASPVASPAPTPRRSAASRRRRTTPAIVKEEVDESMADASMSMAVESEPESSDSDGSYAISLRGEDAEPPITICKWHEDDEPTPCNEDLEATDRLVRHVQDAHLGQRKPRYTCEWVECPRKGVAQGSRFALTAHMRSHTGEKPFICQQPECDKTFTRSDALAKHMRSSHNTEARRGARANLDQAQNAADAEQAVEKLGDDYNVVPNTDKLEAAIKAPSLTTLLMDDAEVQEIVATAAAAAATAAGARKRRRQNGHGHAAGHVDPSTGGGGNMGSDSDDELPEDTLAQWRQLKQRYKWATDRARDLDDALRVAEAELAHERLLKERLLDEQIRKELGANASLFLY